jgi:DNA repair protein RadC
MKSSPCPIPEVKPHYHGHRQRLREKFREHGHHPFADYELVELLLCLAIPREDVKPLAKRLLQQFGSLSSLLAAETKILLEIDGVGPAVVHVLKLVEAFITRSTHQKIIGKIVLQGWQQVIDYCLTTMSYQTREQLRLLFLDAKNQLIRDEVFENGTVNHLTVYPREIFRRALELEASGIILVHNHPSGDPMPSRADIDTTVKIQKIADELGIYLHDHLIIGQGCHTSMKGLGIL